MTGYLAVGVIVALVLVVFNLVLTFALIRKVKDSLGSSTVGRHPAIGSEYIGSTVGPFEVATTAGALSVADLAAGRSLVCFVSPTCEPCRTVVAQLASVDGTRPEQRYDVDRLVVFVLGSGAEVDGIAARLPTAAVAGVSQGDALSGAFGGIQSYPMLLRVENGTIIGAGASLDRATPMRLTHPTQA